MYTNNEIKLIREIQTNHYRGTREVMNIPFEQVWVMTFEPDFEKNKVDK